VEFDDSQAFVDLSRDTRSSRPLRSNTRGFMTEPTKLEADEAICEPAKGEFLD
jgi:hypothetical protein